MQRKVTKLPSRSNGHLRFTSNVLRSLGVANDLACFVVAFLLAIVVYDLTIGYYYDAQLHRTGAIILCINYFLIRVSRDGYAVFKGQGEDVGGSAIADFLLATGLTSLVILQLGMVKDFSRGLAAYFVAIQHGCAVFEPDPVSQINLGADGQGGGRPARRDLRRQR